MKFTVAIVMLAVLVAARFGGKCGFSVQVRSVQLLSRSIIVIRGADARAHAIRRKTMHRIRGVCVCVSKVW